jgi:hypothetical protein
VKIGVLVLVVALGGVFVVDSAAAAQPPGASYPSQPIAPLPMPYGDAGCGLGSILFGDTRGAGQIFASTTNTTFYSQTFGITSGTSNCVDVVPGYASARQFSETNRPALSKEIARGGGESVRALSSLGGCRDAVRVGASLQRQFRRIVPDAAVSDRAFGANVVDAMAADRSLGCARLAPVAAR